MQSAQPQKITVFQQNGSATAKIAGIRRYGPDLFDLQVVSIDEDLPPVLDDTAGLLPTDIQADLVLDFLQHPDLSQDLARLCRERGIPVVASGKKHKAEGLITPPT